MIFIVIFVKKYRTDCKLFRNLFIYLHLEITKNFINNVCNCRNSRASIQS